MKPITRSVLFIFMLGGMLLAPTCLVDACAQHIVSSELTSTVHGKLMLAGTGRLSSKVQATFAYLAEEEEGILVILTAAAFPDSGMSKQWQELVGKVTMIQFNAADNSMTEADVTALQEATAVWLEDDLSIKFAGSSLNQELNALLQRGGAVGGQGPAAEGIATLVKDGHEMNYGFNLLPNSFVMATSGEEDQFINTLNSLPGKVGWKIPPQAAVVIHSGRQISVIGDPDITLGIAANGDWPARIAKYGPPIDELPYTADLIAWNRSAASRLGELFPPEVAQVPEVPSGALVIIGGHGYPEGMWEKVIEFAGGKDAHYVCLEQSANSAGAEMLRSRGCRNIAVHLVRTGVDGRGQGSDPKLLSDLKMADAVYFGGGRTYRFMDAYLGTEAHMLMNNLLERGGIIVGSSAGAQIQGDFLVRGDPRTNENLWMEGNDMGLGFLKGVIIDVHFRERGRENILPSLLAKHPQMLGIGIDETTAIFVQGTIAEVLGPHSVTFYNREKNRNHDVSSSGEGKPIILMGGEKYDLKQRKLID